jgi:hypothetical protein
MKECAMSASRHPVDPTDEQLRLAVRQLRRPNWPAELQDCLDHAIYGPCIRGLARTMARAKPTVPQLDARRVPSAATVPATPTQADIQARPRPGFKSAKTAQASQPFDARRAAANDIDRDD